MRISAFIITKNEAHNIERCLNSLRFLVDEIVVVDSGSSDGTRELAQKLGARVIERAWDGFVLQKNFALEQCKYDWVLTLDADEELSPELQLEIGELKRKFDALQTADGARQIVAYGMPRRVFYEGRWILHGDWNPDHVTRFFRRSRACYEGGDVHERVELRGELRNLNAPILHFSYRDRDDHLQRIHEYSMLWARSQNRRGKKIRPWSPAGRAALRFARALILKRGFLDGRLGVRIAAFSAYEVFLKYRKLRSLGSKRPMTSNAQNSLKDTQPYAP